MLFTAIPAEANEVLANIVINENQLVIPNDDQPAVIVNGRTYVPLKVISQNLGADVQWLSETKQVIITTANNAAATIPERQTEGKKDVEIVVDGQVLNINPQLGKAYITQKNRTMVPFRVITEALGCDVNWQQESKTVIINTKPVTTEPVTPQPTTPDPVITGPVNPEPEVKEPEVSLEDQKLLQDLAAYNTNLKLINGSVINSSQLINMDQTSFTPEQMEKFRSYRNELSKYDSKIKLPDGTNLNTADLTVLGPAIATAEQLNKWIESETPRMRTKMEQLNREFIPIPEELAELYIRIGEEYGIRGDLAFCQAVKETHYFQFTGDVQPGQNNYCGLWATGSPLTGQESYNGADPEFVSFQPGTHGATFSSPEKGVEAHIQHLYAYATKQELPAGKKLVDPRFSLVSRGVAPTWQGLNARWAVPGITYGQSIIQDYWKPALSK